MREDRRKRYDDGFRREALGLIKAGVGYVSLARRLAMPAYTAKQWTMLYRSGGEESFMGAQGSRRYDWETKAAAARDHVDNGLTVTEVMAKYDVASVAPLQRWCREYRAGAWSSMPASVWSAASSEVCCCLNCPRRSLNSRCRR